MVLSQLVADLRTNWKNDATVLRIVEKHAPKIDGFFETTPDTEMYPPRNLILAAFNHFDIESTKVVILGQDVYPNGQGCGLSFSTLPGCKCPPSLRNIFKELARCHADGTNRTNTDLTDWAQQGVLMLNMSLTVAKGRPLSHMKVWKDFTTDILTYVHSKQPGLVYMLWGNFAIQTGENIIDEEHNLVLRSVHPSPLAQTRQMRFVGNNHFVDCNAYLVRTGKTLITW
jgi:uracil-DNA glycosylase